MVKEWTLEDNVGLSRVVKSTYDGADENAHFEGSVNLSKVVGEYTLLLNVDRRHFQGASYDHALNQLNLTYQFDDSFMALRFEQFEYQVPQGIERVMVLDPDQMTFNKLDP